MGEKSQAPSNVYVLVDLARAVAYGFWWFFEANSPVINGGYLTAWSFCFLYAAVWAMRNLIPALQNQRWRKLDYIPALVDPFVFSVAVMSTGGVGSWVVLTYLFGVAISAANVEFPQGAVQLAVTAAMIAAVTWLSYTGAVFPINVLGGTMRVDLVGAVLYNGLSVFVLGLTYQTIHGLALANQRTNKALAAERERSERLLLNIMPEPISYRLKAGEHPIADAHPAVSVVFADIVGFTSLSNSMAAGLLVSLLDDLFRRIDTEARRLGVEKIKTIGDCYMAVAGIPEPCADHADRALSLGRAILRCVEAYNEDHSAAIHVRVGINSGSAVAGVIGEHKFTYDLWGDTVNTASRMESFGAPDAIMLSDATKSALLNDYPLKDNGVKQIPGKGPMQTWLLL